MTEGVSALAFERRYAKRLGVTLAWLRERGWMATPCDCGDNACEGWQMAGPGHQNKKEIRLDRHGEIRDAEVPNP